MTLEEFLTELEKTPRDWHIESDGVIRNRRNECPACVVSNALRHTRYALAWDDAAKALGMLRADGAAIAEAADEETGHDRALRERLMQACGLAPLPQQQQANDTAGQGT